MNEREKWLRAAFGRDTRLPETMESRLSQVYEQIRRESRGKEPIMKYINTTGARARRQAMRTILIAAAVVAVLTISALAVYQYSLSDRVVETYTVANGEEHAAYSIYGAVAGNTGADENGTDGLTDRINATVEAQAYAEWLTIWAGFQEEDRDAVNLLDTYDPHRYLYGLAYSNMAEELDALAEEYGLRLWTAMAATTAFTEGVDALCAYLGIDSFGLEAEEYEPGIDNATFGAVIFDDGSFRAVHVSAGLETSIDGMNFYRSAKGTITTF